MKRADLHMHSNVSHDAKLTPKELIRLAKKQGFACIALTDHNKVGGLPEALREGKKQNIEVIPGVEIFAELDEVLGYFIDYKNKSLLSMLKTIKKRIDEQSKKKIEKLQALGFKLDYKELKRKFRHRSIYSWHIAKIMVEKGYVKTKQEAYNQYLSIGRPAHAPIKDFTLVQVIKAIKKAKGLAVLPHPCLADDPKKLLRLLPKLKKAGLIGVETTCLCPRNKKIMKEFKKEAKHLSLIQTAGSDFHSLKEHKNRLGKYNCPYKIVEQLKEKYKQVYA